MSSPLISIIVPCYNQAQYLDECLQSVLDQTYQDWECIIVNDGSPDDTEEVAKKWLDKDVRFKYLKKQNGGLSSARNAGIEIAEGEWILPLDCDDKIAKNYLSLATEKFSENYTVIYCEAEYFGAKTGNWKLPNYSLKNLAEENIIFCTAFFQKKNWEKVGGYDENMKHGLEDWEFWISLLKNEGVAYQLNETCFFYRIKENSMLTNLHQSNKMDKMLFYIEKKHLDFFHSQLGSIHRINKDKNEYHKISDLLRNQLTEIASSKRYQMIDKVFSIFNR